MVLHRPIECTALIRTNVFMCPIVRISATRSEWLASIRNSVYFHTGKSGVAAHPGLCDKGSLQLCTSEDSLGTRSRPQILPPARFGKKDGAEPRSCCPAPSLFTSAIY